MLKPLGWIVLALQALAQAGLAQAAPAPSSVTAADPAAAPSTDPGQAPLAQRQAAWRRLRILDLNDDGEAYRNGRWLGRDEQIRLYRKHDADDSLALLRRSKGHAFLGWCGMLLTPGALALAGAGIGEREDLLMGRANTVGMDPGTTVGAASGALLGLVLGGAIQHFQSAEADDLRAQAAESYNRKLLDDLQLGVAPVPGGARLGVTGKF
jgi:hypothetical protein